MFSYEQYLQKTLDSPTASKEARDGALQDLRRKDELKQTMVWIAIGIALALACASLAQVMIPPGAAENASGKWQRVFGSLLWSFAWLSAGLLLGFLFGIPKITQGDSESTSGSGGASPGVAALAYRQAVNTNLEQISDWLTKIIVGLGLVQLNHVPGLFDRIALHMTSGACAIACAPLATAMVMTFSICGFICGYLTTRMFLAPAFGRADIVDPRASIPAAPAVVVDRPPGQPPQPGPSGHPSDVGATCELARRQLQRGSYEAATAIYSSVAKTTDEPLVHYEYAIALSHLNGEHSPVVRKELLISLAKIDQLETNTQRDLYTWLTYLFLYYRDERGWEQAIKYGESAQAKKLGSGAMYTNLACAYAQAFSQAADESTRASSKKKVIDYIGLACVASEHQRQRLMQLLRKGDPSKDPEDNDLEVFEHDEDVRAALGLPQTTTTTTISQPGK